ncbi:lytic transglycosylase domain-containing protein [Ectothiorhodospiraceae bacterium 2226]|nr:lytic transglycosylase domain-containing protein [Ectothiorhodospiraceae bacterium 2226]
MFRQGMVCLAANLLFACSKPVRRRRIMINATRTGLLATLFMFILPFNVGADTKRTQGVERAPCYTAACGRVEGITRQQVEAWVHELAPEFGLDPELVLIIIGVESAFLPNAVSHRNAHGLMQLIPATAKRFGVDDIMNPIENLRGGMAYLQWLMRYFDHDLELALAAYNAGEGAVQRYRGIPPFPETQAYVRRITQSYSQLVAAAGD